jgi:hypothetical protein
MKVLLLNPHVQSEHSLVKVLQARGYAVLLPGNAVEAFQMLVLHGTSIDLAVVHREDSITADNENGLKFVAKLKADPAQADLPVIVTSQTWKDSDFSRHQATPQGVNAYMRWPFQAADLISLIEAVFGGSNASGGGMTATTPSLPSFSTSNSLSNPSGFVLQDASGVHGKGSDSQLSSQSIHLDAPEYEQSNSQLSQPGVTTLTDAPDFTADPTNGQGINIPTAMNEIQYEVLPTPSSRNSAGEIEIASEPPAAVEESPAFEVAAPTSDAFSVQLTHESNSIDSFNSIPEAQDATVLHGANGPAKFHEVPTSFPTSVVNPAPPADASLAVALEANGMVGATAYNNAPDADAVQEMPYLFNGPQGAPGVQGMIASSDPAMAFAQPLGDAVVPGGAAHSPDVETLKKYLLLREQDVAVLSTQLRSTQSQLKTMEDSLRVEKGANAELTHVTTEQRRKIDDFEREKQNAVESLQGEINELKFQLKTRSDKARILEGQVREAADEMERLKERVRTDIRKIRVREKELENRLEIMKKDSEALIGARENKIIELKRKLDLLEFNMDLLQDQHARERENSVKLRERLARAAQVVRVAGGLLDNPGGAAQLAAALAAEEKDSA